MVHEFGYKLYNMMPFCKHKFILTKFKILQQCWKLIYFHEAKSVQQIEVSVLRTGGHGGMDVSRNMQNFQVNHILKTKSATNGLYLATHSNLSNQ